jgi:CheY-like chemotaxis protein
VRLGPTVLIVDDDEGMVETMALVLGDQGYDAVVARDGQDALRRLLQGLRPAVIFLDFMMPRMDGRQFRSELVRHPELAAIPIVVISADGSLESKAAEVGAAAWLRKPFKLTSLLETASRLSSRGQGS